ncbi:unnamed protein product, partial [Durusdinium trenchii]
CAASLELSMTTAAAPDEERFRWRPSPAMIAERDKMLSAVWHIQVPLSKILTCRPTLALSSPPWSSPSARIDVRCHVDRSPSRNLDRIGALETGNSWSQGASLNEVKQLHGKVPLKIVLWRIRSRWHDQLMFQERIAIGLRLSPASVVVIVSLAGGFFLIQQRLTINVAVGLDVREIPRERARHR